MEKQGKKRLLMKTTTHRKLGKCGGGKKLGISLNFPTEEDFLKYVRDKFIVCWDCSRIYFRKDMRDVDRYGYLCNDCKSK